MPRRIRNLSTNLHMSNSVATIQQRIRPAYSLRHVVVYIEKIMLLIEDYHNSPDLWNNKLYVYKDNRMKSDKLQQASVKYVFTMSDAKK